MRLLTLLGASLAATLTLSQVAIADTASRIACLPTAGVSEEPYYVDCASEPGVDCTCKEGFTAFDPSIEDDATGTGGRPQPISASPG
jgi:hypothetical protein